MQVPETKPCDDPESLWVLQVELLDMAQSVLGRRDQSKRVFQPQFTDGVPQIRNTPSLDGAYAELSQAAVDSWPEVIFELAHETVHLLNPIPGNTNNLEEGVAVAFSLHVQSLYGIDIRPSISTYLYAFQLANMLPGGPLEVGKRIREHLGALSNATEQKLGELFPDADAAVLRRLAEPFIRNAG